MPTTEVSSQDVPNDLLLRPAEPVDAETVALLFGSVRSAAVPFIPSPVHTPDDDLVYFGRVLSDGTHECWIAEVAGTVVGFAVITPTWLDHLYVAPAHQREGIGTALLDLVKSLRPDGFGLWVFESNAPARAFYARHGLAEVERTDGADNEERAPDIRMVWPAAS